MGDTSASPSIKRSSQSLKTTAVRHFWY